jgi:two-component system phosphate regulon sensor histidine kinase PhoR
MNTKKNNNNAKISIKDLPISSIVFSGKVKFWKLAKTTFIFSAAPALILTMFYVYGQLNYHQAVYLFSAIFLVALMFNYPYIADLQEVTNYVERLVENKSPDQPDLSFINNVEELSTAIQKLNISWQDKNDALKILLLEDEILINSLPNILLMLDSDLNFIQTNEAAKNTFGWNYEEIINQIIASEKTIVLCKKVMETGEGANLKYEISEPYYFFNIRAEKFPINSPNKIAIVLVLQNLTDEKKNEKMLNDFVANASHEMKTPLASISGFIETLSELENDPEAEKQFLKIMKEQSDRMNRLINDLLMLSIIESKSNKDKYENLNLQQLANESLVNLGSQIKAKGIKIKTEVEGGIPDIFGNRDEVVRIFDNLISNSVKYSNDNGEVLVKFFTVNNETAQIRDFPTDQKLIAITVQDFGEGIDEKYIPRLTERFFRVDKARTRVSGGTGLGLAIVQQIVDNHNGYLDIKSKLGHGSTFTVYLPV